MRLHPTRRSILVALAALPTWAPVAAKPSRIRVSPTGKGGFKTLGAAYDALPASGGVIALEPGTYREKLTFDKPGVRLVGTGENPADVVIVWGDSAKMAGGTGKSASLTVRADGFQAENLTIQNDYHLNNPEPSQAVALYLVSDRAVLRDVRLLGAQDTLYAASHKGSQPSRQYFLHCEIEGHVDFIFGNASAFFDRCRINVLKRDGCCITAQSNNGPDERSAYVFDNCVISADPGVNDFYLGRAWRPYARVVFLNAHIYAPLNPEGWREWTPGKTETWKTAYFAEYRSDGPGANPKARLPWSHQLSDSEAENWRLKAFFPDHGWLPTG